MTLPTSLAIAAMWIGWREPFAGLAAALLALGATMKVVTGHG